MTPRPIRILGIGIALPERKVTDVELEHDLALPTGWIKRTGGVVERYWVRNETPSQLGALAARRALQKASLAATDVDLIVCASQTLEQPIPCTAALIQRELGIGASGIPCFDVRATCLSFLVAFDMAASFLAAGTHKRILIVSPEVASVGLNKKQRESYTLLGDGAGAVVVALPEKGQASALVSARFGTWSQHADLCRIKGGGAKLYPTQLTDENRDDFLFEMDGVASYRAVAQVSPQFLADVLDGRDIDDVAYVIPHQASRLAIELMFQRRLKIPAERVVNVLAKYGNTIAASIPMAMHDAIEDGRIERGDLLLLAGSSAGLSLGGLLVVY